MNKIYELTRHLKSALLIFCVGVFVTASAQLSGTYTLDAGSATGGTNYQNWQDFRSDLITNGVNGAVVVNVITDMTETAQINFGAITGTSSTNTITINGNGKFVQAGISDAVILMNGADYMTFDGLVVRNTTNNANVKGFRFLNESDYNTIKNCTIEFSALTATSTTSSAYIAFSTSSTSSTTSSSTSHGIFNTIDKNLMRTTNSNSPGPAFGVAIQGSTSTYSSTAQNNTISNNTIQNFYSMAIRLYYTNGVQVLNNDISRANATSNNSSATLYGIYSYYSYAANRPTKLDGNNLHDWPFSGATPTTANTTTYSFYTYYNYGNATYPFSISGNTIENVMASTNNYLGYNYYNYYFNLMGNMATNNDVTKSTSSSFNFHGWLNYGTYNEYRFNNNTIQNCDGGYYWYGIRNEYPNSGVTVGQIMGNTIKNNTQAYYYHYSIRCYYTYNNAAYPIDISDNVIEANTSDYYYHYSIYAYFYGNYNIERNVIKNNRNTGSSPIGYYHYSIYNYYNYNSKINSNLIVDNAAYYYSYPIYCYSFNNGNYSVEIMQNTVRANGSLSSNSSDYLYAFYIYCYYHTKIKVIGNILDAAGQWYGYYPVYTYNLNGSTPYTWDYNSYYINNMSIQYWYSPSGNSTNFAGWASNGMAGPNEKYIANGHNFATNFASDRFLNQNNVPTSSSNPKDVTGALRNPAFSDRGAVEGVLDIAQVANDFNPPSPVCAGYAPSPTLTFKNNFAEPVTGFKVACSDNGVIKAVKDFTNTIPINGTNTVTFDPILFSQAGQHTVKFFLLAADDLPSNDSMTFSFNVLKSPGGSAITHNAGLSSAAAQYKTDGKPDLTFPNEKMVYDIGNPLTVGYTASDYGSKWVGSVSAKTINGFTANSTVTANFAAPFVTTVDAGKTWEDSTLIVSIKITDLVTGCDTIYTRRILIAPKAVPDAKLPIALCEKSDLIFESTSTVSSGAIDYEWDFGDGTPTTNEASPSHNYATFGQYTVTLKTTTNPHGFTTSKTFILDITEVPLATIINTNACEGVAVKLKNGTVYGGSGTISYSWDYGDGSAVNNTNSQADIFKSYAIPGGYKVSLTASADGCSNKTEKVVYQFAKPVANFTQVSGNCLNTEFKFENKSSITLGQFGNLWDFNDAGNQATVKEPSYMFSSAGTKNVKLEVVSEFGCTDSKTIPIEVKQTPTTDYMYPFACSRTSTPFTNTTNLNGEVLLAYFWDFGDGFTSSASNPLKNWTSIGPRIVKLTTSLVNGCSTSESKIINVGVQPAVNFTVEDRCAGSEVPFTNLTTFSQGDITYTWNFGDGNISNVAAPVHAYGSGVSQTYTVQLKASIAGGCSDSASKTVTINPLPTTCNFTIDGTLNAAGKSPLTFVPSGGSTSNIDYTWITGDGNSVSSSNGGTSYNYNAPGKYCITMIARNSAGCECSSTNCVTMSTAIVDAESMSQAVQVYPNPNGGVFNVSISAEINSEMVVNIYNTLGELVKTITVDSNVTSIDMSDFASGVYVVKVSADQQTAIKKITITK